MISASHFNAKFPIQFWFMSSDKFHNGLETFYIEIYRAHKEENSCI